LGGADLGVADRRGIEQALALAEHHRVHPQLNMQAAPWPN
jgi:hypothetical protein